MNQNQENMELGAIAMPQQMSPGEMLKRAREGKNLSHIDVAKQLKLRVQWIVDIENDHYHNASALIYVRGYLRSYARLVDLSADEIMRVFDNMKFDEPFLTRKIPLHTDEQFVMQQSVLSYSKSKFHKGLGKKKSIWFGTIVVLALIAVMALWWRSEHMKGPTSSAAQPQVSLQTITPTVVTQQPAPVAVAAPVGEELPAPAPTTTTEPVPSGPTSEEPAQ